MAEFIFAVAQSAKRAQVQVVMPTVVTMVMFVEVPVMVMLVLEQPGADQIDDQPDDRHADGLIETNRLRGDETMDRLARHEQGKVLNV